MKTMAILVGAAAIAITPAGATAALQGAGAAKPAAALDANAVVADVQRILNENYVLPELRPQLSTALAKGLADGHYDVSDPGDLGLQDAFINDHRQAAALARVDDPGEVTHRSIGTGIEDVEYRHAILIDCGAQCRQIGIAIGFGNCRKIEILCASKVRRIDCGHTELRIRWLLLFGAAP